MYLLHLGGRSQSHFQKKAISILISMKTAWRLVTTEGCVNSLFFYSTFVFLHLCVSLVDVEIAD